MLILRIQVIYRFSFEVTLLRAHPGGVLASSSTLILVLREGRGRKFNFGSYDLIYHVSKALEIFLAACQFFWSFHILALSVCTRSLSEAPWDIVTQHEGAWGFPESGSVLIVLGFLLWSFDVFLNWNLWELLSWVLGSRGRNESKRRPTFLS